MDNQQNGQNNSNPYQGNPPPTYNQPPYAQAPPPAYNQPPYAQAPPPAYNQPPYAQAPPPKKKGGCLKGCLITLLIFIIILALLIVGGILLVKKAKEPLVVDYSKSDIASFYEKTGMEEIKDRPSIEQIMLGKYTSSGEIPFEGTLTSEEITAIFQSSSAKTDAIENVSIILGDDGEFELGGVISENVEEFIDDVPNLETSGKILDMLVGSPIYLKGTLEYDRNSGFSMELDKGKLGIIGFPESVKTALEDSLVESLNSAANSIDGFNIDEFEITEDGLEFEGTVPESVNKID